MKRALLLAGLLLVLANPAVCAAGVSLSWGNTCWGDAGSTNLLTWACNSNTYAGIRVTCSFSVDASRDDFLGAAVHLSGRSESASVPDWWRMSNTDPTDCRHNAVVTVADYTVLPQPEDGGVCRSPFGGDTPSGGIGLYSWDGNRMHLNAIWALAEPNTLLAGEEYFLCQFRISAMKTVGDCAGCQAAALWAAEYVEVGYTSEGEYLFAGPPEDNLYLFWQAELPTAARNTTWGQIKGLYR